jgi:hypothetical protein
VSTQGGDQGARDTKPCRVCGEDIKFSAQKCIHCDSYQDWRVRLGIGSTVLALLVALVSVVTNGVPILRAAFEARIIPLKFVFQDTFSGTHKSPSGTDEPSQIAAVWVYNAGTDPAFVSQLNLSIDGAKGGSWRSGAVPVDDHGIRALSPIEIPGRTGRTVRFDLGNREASISDAVKTWKSPFRCEFAYTYVNGAGEPKADRGVVDCTKIEGVPWL